MKSFYNTYINGATTDSTLGGAKTASFYSEWYVVKNTDNTYSFKSHAYGTYLKGTDTGEIKAQSSIGAWEKW